MNGRALAVQGAGFGPASFAVQGVRPDGAHNREVAVQGIGYGSGSMALQGFRRQSTEYVVPQGGPGGPVRRLAQRKPVTRRDRDDDVLLFLLR